MESAFGFVGIEEDTEENGGFGNMDAGGAGYSCGGGPVGGECVVDGLFIGGYFGIVVGESSPIHFSEGFRGL